MTKNKLLQVGLLNAGSLGTFHDDFIVNMEKYSVDLMAINETWLKLGEDDKAPIVPNYRLRHTPRPVAMKDGRGGGVGFYIRQGISVKFLNSINISEQIEQMWLKLSSNSKKVIIGTAYRPRWVNVELFFECLLETIASFPDCDNLILLGDFNINFLDKSDNKCKILEEFLSNAGLSQQISAPTHFTDTSETLINLV